MSDQSEIEELLIKLESPLPVCRVCLTETLQYIDFEASLCVIDDIEVTYLDGYKEVTNSIALDQNLPSRLCVDCANDLCNAYLFARRVENAENILKRLQAHIDCKNKFGTSKNYIEGNHEHELPLESSSNIIAKAVHCKPTKNVNAISEIEDDSESPVNDQSIDQDTCWKCKDCGKVCTSTESYRKHCLPHQLAKCKTKTRKSIKCKQCGKQFKFYVDLEKHLFIHAMAKIQISKGGKMTYVCNTCSKSYQSVFAFVDHMHIHNGTKPYKCSICGAFRHTRAKLKSHKYHSHGKGLELRLAIKNEKMKFMETEPLRFKSKCRYCGKLVVNEVIKRHEKMHENPEKRFQCSVCSKTFYTEQNLKFHSETHLEIRKPFKCKICGQEILRQYSMKLHMQTHDSEEKKFKCDICGTALSAKGSLTEHREKHFSDSKYKCEHCDKTFIRKSRLVYHMRSHTGENPFKCTQCNKSYKMAGRLKSHIRVAHANQTYDCSQCDAKFKSYSGFINHRFMHTGYPFKCPQCNKGTPNRERLKKHLLQVHKGYMSSTRFDEVYPKKTETRKVQLVKPDEDLDAQYEVIVQLNSEV